MDIRSTKTRAELEEDEARRLIRKAPKYKPPRRDRRRERDNSDQEVDPDEVADRKDRSENYKDVGGSMAQRVASRHLVAIEFDTKDEKEEYLEEHPGADPTKHMVKEEAEAEEGAAEEEDGGKRGEANQKILELAKSNPRLKAQLKEWKHGDFYIPLVQSNPDFTVEKTAIGKYLPEELRGITVGELDKILSSKTTEKPPKAKKTKEPKKTPEAPPPKDEDEAPSEAEELELGGQLGEQPKAPVKPAAPTRPPATREQYAASIRKALDVFPEEYQEEILSAGYHPADLDVLTANYQALTSQPTRNIGAYADKVSKFYTTDPSKVEVPKSIASLPPEAQPESFRKHQLRTVAISLAAKKQVAEALQGALPKGADPVLIESLASTMLEPPSEKRTKLSQMTANKLYDHSASGPGAILPFTQIEKFLVTVGKNPDAQRVAVGYLQGNDLALAKNLFISKGPTGWRATQRGLGSALTTPGKMLRKLLKSSTPESSIQPISEWDNPKTIGKGIQSAIDFIRNRGKLYPEVPMERDPAEAFKQMTLARIKTLAPAKATPVKMYLEQKEVENYDRDLRDYEHRLAAWETDRDLHVHEKHLSEPVPPKRADFDSEESFSDAQAAYQELKSERDATGTAWEGTNPKPKPPVKPLRYDEIKNPKALQDMRKSLLAEQFAQYGNKTAAKVAAQYVISSYPTPRSMAALPEKTAIYHGVAPYKDAPQYAAWLQVHQRDIGEADLDTLLKSAREWLKTPVLDLPLEATPRDVQLRAALDLAIYDSHYNGQIQPNLYNHLLARLAGADENSTLLTQRQAIRLAMEFDTPEALKEYLSEHPNADRSKHTVKGDGAKEKSEDEAKSEDTKKTRTELRQENDKKFEEWKKSVGKHEWKPKDPSPERVGELKKDIKKVLDRRGLSPNKKQLAVLEKMLPFVDESVADPDAMIADSDFDGKKWKKLHLPYKGLEIFKKKFPKEHDEILATFKSLDMEPVTFKDAWDMVSDYAKDNPEGAKKPAAKKFYEFWKKEATMKASNEIRKLAAKYAAENASLAYDLMDLASKVAQDEEQGQGQQKQAQDQQEDQGQEKQAAKYASLRSAVITAASKNPGAREAFIPVLQAIKSLG